MNTRGFLPSAVSVGITIGVLATPSGCGKKPEQPDALFSNYSHNLKYVRCHKYTHPDPKDVLEVEIKKDVGVGAVDKAIFVCVGDKVRWYTNDKDFPFTVAFDEKSATKDLFGLTTTTIDSHPDTSSAKHEQVTDDLTVTDTVEIFKDFPYKPQTKNSNGKTISVGDPHVIPMGK